MDERRLLLFAALSLIVFSLYFQFQQARRPPVTPTAPPTAPPPTMALGEPERAPKSHGEAAAAEEAVDVAPRGDDRERRIEVVLPHGQIAFTNRGARLVSWQLSKFLDDRGRPEEMLTVNAAAPRALDVETDDDATNRVLRDALFVASTDLLELKGTEEGTLQFEYAAGDLSVVKTYRFRADSPLVELKVSLQRRGSEMDKRVLWGPGIGLPGEEKRDTNRVVALVGGRVERIEVKKLKDQQRVLDGVRWIGVENLYFAALLLAPEGETRTAVARVVEVASPTSGQKTPRPTTAVRMAAEDALQIYVGPKDYFALTPLGRDLKAVVPVGEWIGPIVVPFMALLRWVHGHVGNYGWSIVLLTVLISLAMAPFRHFGIVNGIKMARMAPEMRVIQERYRKLPLMERQPKMQPELQALYARHGISMGGQMATGCLPLLLTMPFLIAFYRVLEVSIDLKGASFLWLPDLSLKDPYFLTPILMGLSMFLMQRMMPSAMDPAQQRMMMLMPIVLVVMFSAAPAGLNLYWLASNVCAIAQQGVTMSLHHGGGPESKKKERRR